MLTEAFGCIIIRELTMVCIDLHRHLQKTTFPPPFMDSNASLAPQLANPSFVSRKNHCWLRFNTNPIPSLTTPQWTRLPSPGSLQQWATTTTLKQNALSPKTPLLGLSGQSLENRVISVSLPKRWRGVRRNSPQHCVLMDSLPQTLID